MAAASRTAIVAVKRSNTLYKKAVSGGQCKRPADLTAMLYEPRSETSKSLQRQHQVFLEHHGDLRRMLSTPFSATSSALVASHLGGDQSLGGDLSLGRDQSMGNASTSSDTTSSGGSRRHKFAEMPPEETLTPQRRHHRRFLSKIFHKKHSEGSSESSSSSFFRRESSSSFSMRSLSDLDNDIADGCCDNFEDHGHNCLHKTDGKILRQPSPASDSSDDGPDSDSSGDGPGLNSSDALQKDVVYATKGESAPTLPSQQITLKDRPEDSSNSSVIEDLAPSIEEGTSPNAVLQASHANKKASKKAKSVSFSDVEFRMYNVILGDNPCVSEGPPLSIGWSVLDTESFPIDEYEMDRPPRRDQNRLLLHKWAREERLRLEGYGKQEFRAVEKEVKLVQKSRKAAAGHGHLHCTKQLQNLTQLFRLGGSEHDKRCHSRNLDKLSAN